MSVATPPPPVAETPPMNSQPSPRNTAVQNRALWRVARREMRSNIGRTSLVAGFTLFGMLSAAATVALFGWGVQPDPNTLDVPWWSPFVALITSIPPMLVALLPTMLIIGAAFSVSTKRRSTHYQRLRSIGARNDQILRLVIFEALVPAAMSAAVAGVILTVALIILGATPLWIIIALTVMIAVTLFAIGAAAWFPARSILTTSLEPGPATPARRPQHAV